MPQRLEPSAKQLSSIVNYLRQISARTRQRAAELARFKTVKDIWWETDTMLAGEVQGGAIYTQGIEFGPKDIGGTFCSCPMEMDCKHVAALLITFSKGWMIRDEDSDEEEDGDDEEDEDEDEDEAETKPGSQRLAEALAVRFGQALTPADQKRARQIDELFRNNTPQASGSFLANLAGFSKPYLHYYDPPVVLWPRDHPPANVIEAWIYTTYALQNKKLLSAGDKLFQGVTPEELQRLLEPWQRREAILQWEQKLAGILKIPDVPVPVSPAYRLRLDLGGAQIESRANPSARWEPVKITPLRQLVKAAWSQHPELETHYLDDDAIRFLRATCSPETYNAKAYLEKSSPQFTSALNRLLRLPSPASSCVVSPAGTPVPIHPEPVAWNLDGPHLPDGSLPAGSPDAFSNPASDYILTLRQPDGTPLEHPLAFLPGHPNLVLTLDGAWPLPGPPHAENLLAPGTRIPALAIESTSGLSALDRLQIPVPAPIRSRIRTLKAAVTVRCAYQSEGDGPPLFKVQAIAQGEALFVDEYWKSGTWLPIQAPADPDTKSAPAPAPGTITRVDRSLQSATSTWLSRAYLSAPAWPDHLSHWMHRPLNRAERVAFPDEFLDWISQRPEHITVELDQDLASLRDHGKVTGTFNLDLQETGIDWFDLTLNLKLSDVELSQKEIDLLLKNTGSWVQLPGRGWRKLEFEITEENRQQLADLGLSPPDLHATEKQRLHVLQLAHPSSAGFLPADRAEQVQRRAADLRTTVSPSLPAGITATLRPYQMEGFHFLAYLSTNHFGGILADDMGLGKTLQALTWLAWLQASSQLHGQPILVVCPKSVQDNWTSEAAKFYPGLPVRQWTSATAGDLENLTQTPVPAKKTRSKKPAPQPAPDATTAGPPLLLIINYTQLRLHAAALSAVTWSTVILDEAQYIKNPTSATARTACSLTARHRLALSGTPIENRLLDLWSIMAFAMPGILGNRTTFAKTFGAKDDPLARRRLSSRVRPFLLRRTKKEVAADLPDRIEEDLSCTLEGPQQEHYLAELKLARSTLLKAKTSAELDKLRFNILTSLLRLRQICCHPSLTGKGSPDMESAKLNALLELLEPLMEEGHKVLIFSQFVEMLHLISQQLLERNYPHLILTGATEDRGSLVRQFQESAGANCFLISLKAGGSGLNLTAASYVILFDPWWNPAVENQAIDRTHRIGQVNKVIAYRLITRDTIEEKIRQLQKTKSALAGDILGEETFAKALTLDDFQFLLSP